MRLTEYKISEKSVLRKGTPFRATQGPYYVTAGGEHIPLHARSPFVFLWAETVKGCDYIHALDKEGFHEVLHVSGERQPSIEGIVARPYKLRNRITKNLHKVKALTKRRRKK